MNYAKPEIALVNTATDAIRGQLPKHGVTSDGQGMNKFITAATYEADE